MAFAAVQTIVTSVLTSGAVTLLLRTYITEKLKARIQAQYAQQLESLKVQLKESSDLRLELHKSELKAKSDVEMERLRSQLAAVANERSTLLSALITKRFEAIALVHASLLHFHQSLSQLVGPFRPSGTDEGALIKSVVDTSADFSEALTNNRVFFTAATAARLIDIRGRLFTQSRLFQYTVMMGADEIRKSENWVKINEEVDGPIKEAIGNLERELRALMRDRDTHP